MVQSTEGIVDKILWTALFPCRCWSLVLIFAQLIWFSSRLMQQEQFCSKFLPLESWLVMGDNLVQIIQAPWSYFYA